MPWQHYFDSSDYAWYNMEAGRYTGISAVWHVNKRLDWYNGSKSAAGRASSTTPPLAADYLTQISYWLDEECKNTKAWVTVLTGPTSQIGKGGINTTVFEFGIQHNWNECWYQIVDTQMVYSKAPIFGPNMPVIRNGPMTSTRTSAATSTMELGHQLPGPDGTTGRRRRTDIRAASASRVPPTGN